VDERRVLTLTHDPGLLEELLRLAAAAGCELHRAPDPTSARQAWSAAPMVLLDEDAARSCARAGLPRRDGVVVVSHGEPALSLWQHAMACGAQHVIALPSAQAWLVNALSDASEGVRRQGPVLAVVGGRGGAGASVLAAAVAVAALTQGERVLLVDCDPLGGGLDLVLGAEDVSGLRWPELTLSGGRVPAASLHAALPAAPVGADGGLSVVSCGRSGPSPAPNAVAAVVQAGRRAGETVVCDLPRYPTEAARAVLDVADLTVLVVPAEVRCCAAAARVAEVLAERGPDVRLVVRGPSPGGLSADDVGRALSLPLLTSMRPEPGLARALDRGRPPGRGRGPLAVAAREVLDVLHGLVGSRAAGVAR
jgi:secretion/DNA translocation related CpaE-like protein